MKAMFLYIARANRALMFKEIARGHFGRPIDWHYQKTQNGADVSSAKRNCYRNEKCWCGQCRDCKATRRSSQHNQVASNKAQNDRKRRRSPSQTPSTCYYQRTRPADHTTAPSTATTYRCVNKETLGTHGRFISPDTVRKRLRTIGNLRCRRPFKGIVLTQRHRNLRYNWARRHLRITQAEWGQVLFTDEKKFQLHGNDCRTRVYRQKGERFNDNCVEEIDRFGGGSVMVWAGVSMQNKTNIVFIDGNLNAARYCNEIIQPEVIPMARNNRGLKLLQDGAPCHTARATIAYLQINNVRLMEIPPKSPDLNIIENVWEELNRRVRRNGIKPRNMQELRAKIVKEWANIPQQYIHRYVTSMRRRCQAVIRAQGGHTRY